MTFPIIILMSILIVFYNLTELKFGISMEVPMKQSESIQNFERFHYTFCGRRFHVDVWYSRSKAVGQLLSGFLNQAMLVTLKTLEDKALGLLTTLLFTSN